MSDNPYLDAAKDSLNRREGDPKSRWIHPSRVQDSYDTLRRAWVHDIGETPGGGGGGSGPPPGAFYVTSYGAVGDGETDDTDAILACIEAAGDGGYVFFPDGVYVISRPLIPKNGQRLEGTWQMMYTAGIHPYRPLSGRQGSVIYASQDFVGDGMILCAQYVYGVHITRLGIIGPGPGHSSGCHGVKLPTRNENTGESSWWVEECLINSMPGHGITGHMWVFDARDTHVSQCSWGIAVTGNDGMLDTRIIGCMFYFNRDGGFLLDGGWTGAIEIIGCRVERSGNLYGYPDTPVNPYAPGVRIRRGQQVILTNVSTDANTGPGLWIGNPDYTVYNILIANCAWARDGGGTQEIKEWWAWVDGVYQQVEEGHPDATTVSGENIPGVWFDRCFDVKMVNNVVSYGKHDDRDEVDGPIGPGIAFKANDTWQCEVSSTRFETIPFDRSLDIDDTNSRLDVHLPQHSLMKVPVAGEAKWLPKMKQIGLVAYQNDLQSLVVQNYNGDWISMVSYDPRYNHVRLPSSVEVRDRDGDRLSQVKFTKGGADDVDGWGLLRWAVGTNPEEYGYTFWIGRYGDDGQGNLQAYIDDPLAINYRTGRVDLNHTYMRSRSPDDVTFIVRGYEDQTLALQEWWADSAIDGADTVAGVRADGRVWGSEATSGSDFVTLDQLENAVSGGGAGDVEFTQYTSSETRDKRLEFRTRDSVTGEVLKLWQMGVNPAVNGNTFYLYRTDDTGAYLDSPVSINRASGRVNLNRAMISNELDPANTVLYLRSTDPLQTGPLIDAAVDGVTMFQVNATGQVTAADGTDDDHLVTKGQLDSALSGQGGGPNPSLTLDGDATTEKRITFETDGLLRWQMGVNTTDTFYIWRADATGAYLDAPLAINYSNGALSTNQQYIATNNPAAVPLQLVAEAGQTARMFVAKDSAGSLLAGITAEGRIFGADATEDDDMVTLGQLKAITAASTDFADFQARIAAL